MAERATKEVLLRLRRARELELRRVLAITRAARTEARRATAAAEAARRRLEEALSRARIDRTELGWSRARRAGRLASAVGYEAGLRQALAEAKDRERAALVALDAAEAQLAASQTSLGEAVHARQQSEALAAAERRAAVRARERREHAEVEDRFRRPPVPRR